MQVHGAGSSMPQNTSPMIYDRYGEDDPHFGFGVYEEVDRINRGYGNLARRLLIRELGGRCVTIGLFQKLVISPIGACS